MILGVAMKYTGATASFQVYEEVAWLLRGFDMLSEWGRNLDLIA